MELPRPMNWGMLLAAAGCLGFWGAIGLCVYVLNSL
jgi:hypothetical protein